MAEKEEGGTYLTIAKDGSGRVIEKMSRFLSFAFHVESSQQARDIIRRLTNEYHDARHVCWAYMIGYQRTDYQSNDNGEPSGTAGKPILGQINSFGLTDVLVVVVRYFGGIKLGTPGLIAAYREAAWQALSDSGTRVVTRCVRLCISVGYESLDKVMKLIKDKGLRIVNQDIEMDCKMEIEIPIVNEEEVKGRLSVIPNLRMN